MVAEKEIDFKNKKAIIWDWNGTLLDDVDQCISCMNRMLRQRNLPLLTKEVYRRIFTFPVKDYYSAAGFDFEKEDFEKPAIEFIRCYHRLLEDSVLFPHVGQVLEYFKKKGIVQCILSAMEHDSLTASLKDKKIFRYFDIVAGINDHYAHSKTEVGIELIAQLPFGKSDILIIGDSLHDLEVADALGVDCLLIANGHQSKERLTARTKNVIDDLPEVKKVLSV